MKQKLLAFALPLVVASICAYAQSYQTTFESARELLKQKRYSEALQEAGRASQLDGSQWGAYFVAGTALVGLERETEAINQFQAALARAPEQAKPTMNQAIAKCRQILANKSQPAQVPYTPPASLPGQQSMLPTNERLTVGVPEAVFGRRNQSVSTRIPISILAGYCVNSNTQSESYLIPFSLKWSVLGALEAGQVTFPRSVLKNVGGQQRSVFAGNFDLIVNFNVSATAPVGEGVAIGKIRYQGCNSAYSFPPRSVDVSVRYQVQ